MSRGTAVGRRLAWSLSGASVFQTVRFGVMRWARRAPEEKTSNQHVIAAAALSRLVVFRLDDHRAVALYLLGIFKACRKLRLCLIFQ